MLSSSVRYAYLCMQAAKRSCSLPCEKQTHGAWLAVRREVYHQLRSVRIYLVCISLALVLHLGCFKAFALKSRCNLALQAWLSEVHPRVLNETMMTMINDDDGNHHNHAKYSSSYDASSNDSNKQ